MENKRKDIMIEKYIRDFTMDCREGKQNITEYPNLSEVIATYRNKAIYPEVKELIIKKGKVIVIMEKSVLVYLED